MSSNIDKHEHCPICHKKNNCCNAQNQSISVCWCSKERFPKEIFDLLPDNQLGKRCICKKCLAKFTR